MESCRISVITVVRNGAFCINRALDSVREQTGVIVEHIVIDGASTDGTVDILRQREAGLAAWISEPDQGISDAFNKGLSRATGDLVGILNADDWYEPEALMRVGAVWAEHRKEILYGSCKIHAMDGAVALQHPDKFKLDREMTLFHPAIFIPRWMHLQYGGYRTDFRIAMDYELLLRLRSTGSKFHQISNEPLANFSLGGVSDRSWALGRRECARARHLHCPTWLNRPRLYAQLIRRQVSDFIQFRKSTKSRDALR